MEARLCLKARTDGMVHHGGMVAGMSHHGTIMILARMEDSAGMSNDDRLFSWGWIKDWHDQESRQRAA